jgi:hypothetical protein
MLRIELLPDYIGDKNKIRNLGLLWVAGVVVVAGLLLAMNSSAGKANEDAKADRAAKEALKATTDKNKKDIADEQHNRAVIESKQKFVLNARTYNDGWAEAFETIRDVKPADNSIVLDSMALDTAKHQTVSLTGFGSDEKAVVRWWMSLRNNTALFDHVNFDLVPHAWTPVADQASNMGGPGGFGSGGSGGFGSGGAPGNKMQNMLTAMGGGMSGGSGGGMSGGGRATAGNGPTDLEGHHGINFTAAVVLKTALAGGIPTPSWSGGGAAPAPTGMGGMGGMGGGMGSGGASGAKTGA